VSVGAGVILFVLIGVTILLRLQMRRFPIPRGPTWGCGYLGKVPRGQYTSSSFAQMLVDLFAWVMRPHKETPRIEALFPQGAHFESHVPDTVLDGAVTPSSQFLYRVFAWSRILHQGNIQAYLLYMIATVILLLIWS
jgi:hydrogenase-4 component B